MSRRNLLLALSGAFALLAALPANAGALYEINVDTTAILSTTGYVDFQFNPGPPVVDPASALIHDFSTDGSLTTPAGDIGDVSGAFPGPVRINNTFASNDHAEGITFGSFFDVFVELDGPAISGNADNGSSFFLTLLDGSFNPIVTAGPLVEIDLDTLGNPTVVNNSLNSEAAVATLPEPGSLLLLAMGLCALFARRRYAAKHPIQGL